VTALYEIMQSANVRWEQARARRLSVAERIADAAAIKGALSEADLESYRELHAEQVVAQRSRTLAAEELSASIARANGGLSD
jgi:hypothetical protein